MVAWIKASPPHPPWLLPRPTGLAVIDTRCCRPRPAAEQRRRESRAEPSGAERKITCPSPLSHIHTELQLTERKLNHFYAETMPQALFQEPQYGELVHVAEALTERERAHENTGSFKRMKRAAIFKSHADPLQSLTLPIRIGLQYVTSV